MRDDSQLLIDFVKERSEAAFAQLVERYLGMVYGVALRMTANDKSLAEDVTQTVFADFSRQASRLTSGTPIGAWLHRHTYFTASKAIRTEQRRRKREAMAAVLQEQHEGPPMHWEAVAPHLDASLSQLRWRDRESLVLRFLQSQSLRSVGEALGISEDAAQKQVSRALERLRRILSRRGVSGTGLSTLLADHGLSAAPSHLVTPVVTQSVAAAETSSWMLHLANALAAGKAKVALGAICLVAIASPIWLQQHAEGLLQAQERRLARLAQDWELAKASHARQLSGPASLSQTSGGPSPEFRELLRLRNLVSQQRQRLRTLRDAKVPTNLPKTRQAMIAHLRKRYAERVAELKHLFAVRHEEAVPEMRHLTEWDWRFLVQQQVSDDEEGVRWLMSRARTMAESEFGNRVIKPALDAYASEHGNAFPESIADLKPHFETPVDADILERWVVMQADRLHPSLRDQIDAGEWVLTQRTAIDPEYDQRYILGVQEGYLFADGPPEFWADSP